MSSGLRPTALRMLFTTASASGLISSGVIGGMRGGLPTVSAWRAARAAGSKAASPRVTSLGMFPLSPAQGPEARERRPGSGATGLRTPAPAGKRERRPGGGSASLAARAMARAARMGFAAGGRTWTLRRRTVKYWIDTEFIERPGLLDLISIG